MATRDANVSAKWIELKLILDKRGRLKPKYDGVRPFDPYDVPLDPARRYVIDMIGVDDNIDSYLFLEDASGEVVATDDDSRGKLDARVIYQPAKKGTFRIKATTYIGAKVVTGAYRLQVWESTAAEPVRVQGPVNSAYQKPVGYRTHPVEHSGGNWLIHWQRPPAPHSQLRLLDDKEKEKARGHFGDPWLHVPDLAKGRYHVVEDDPNRDPPERVTRFQFLEPPTPPLAGTLTASDKLYAEPQPFAGRKYPIDLDAAPPGPGAKAFYYVFQFVNPLDLLEFSLVDARGQVIVRGTRSFYHNPAVDAHCLLTAAMPKAPPGGASVLFGVQVAKLSREEFYRQRIRDRTLVVKQFGALPFITVDLAWSHCMLGDWKAASDEWTRVNLADLSYNADKVRYWSAEAWIAHHNGDWKTVVDAFEHIYKMDQHFFEHSDGETAESKRLYDQATAKLGASAPK